MALIGLDRVTNAIQLHLIDLHDPAIRRVIPVQLPASAELVALAWSKKDRYLTVHDLVTQKIMIFAVSEENTGEIASFIPRGIVRVFWVSDNLMVYAVEDDMLKAIDAASLKHHELGRLGLGYDKLTSINYLSRGNEYLIAAQYDTDFYVLNHMTQNVDAEIHSASDLYRYLSYSEESDSFLFASIIDADNEQPVLINRNATCKLLYNVNTGHTTTARLNSDMILAAITKTQRQVALFSKQGVLKGFVNMVSDSLVSDIAWGNGSHRNSLFIAFEDGNVACLRLSY